MMAKKKKKVPNLRFKGFTDDWEQHKLGDVVNLIGGGPFKSTDSVSKGIPWLKIANVGVNGITWNTESYLPEYFWNDYPQYQLKKGNYVVALTRPILNHRLKISKLDRDALLNQRVAKLTTSENLQYIVHLLERKKVVLQIENNLSGSDPPNLSSKDLYRIKIKIPSESNEQKQIGTFLTKLDSIISLQQRKLELLKEIKKGLLQKMFAEKNSKQPVLRFKGFHDDWEQHRLKDTQTVFTDGNYSSNYPKPKDFTNSSEGIPFLKGSDITDGSLSKKNCKFITLEKNSKLISGQIVPDDVVIAVRGSLGNVGYATKENAGWNINSQLAILRTNKSELKGYFIYSFFLTNIGIRCIRSRITGTALKQLPIKQLASIFVPIANIKEQLKLVRLLKKMDKFITLQQQKLAKYQSIKKSLLQQMFI